MKMKRQVVFVAAVMCSFPAWATDVPERFEGRWGVNIAATVSRIQADPSLSDEHRPGLVRRFTEGRESKMELTVSDQGLEFHGMGRIDFRNLIEDSGGVARLASVMSDPGGSGQEIELVVTLRLDDNESLNLSVDTSDQLADGDDDDFDRVMWSRIEGGSGEGGTARVLNDPVAYLDALQACEPGEYEFTTFGVTNTIVGAEGDGCRVVTNAGQYNLTCDFSAETIALMTTEERYEDARSGVLRGSTDSELSKRASEECRPD